MNKLLSFLLHPYYLLRARIAYDRAIRMAEENLLKTGQRTYVIKGINRTLLLVTRPDFRKLKQQGYINKNARVNDLERLCLYCTSYRNGKDQLPPEITRDKRTTALRWLSSRS